MLSVTDTGIGIDSETQLRIFEPFFTTKETGKGIGFGLATVYGIVKQSGGSIFVSSEPGQGTNFRIYLPELAEEAAAEPVRGTPKTSKSSTGTETVLLVEDDELVRSLTAQVLNRAGYNVLLAANGEEAIQTAERHPKRIHLLLTDLVLSGMSGWDIAQQVIASDANVKVLFMSGYGYDVLSRQEGFDSATPILLKPFNPAALLEKVREILDSQSWLKSRKGGAFASETRRSSLGG
jgi:CheY-like chemotaxis protein